MARKSSHRCHMRILPPFSSSCPARCHSRASACERRGTCASILHSMTHHAWQAPPPPQTGSCCAASQHSPDQGLDCKAGGRWPLQDHEEACPPPSRGARPLVCTGLAPGTWMGHGHVRGHVCSASHTARHLHGTAAWPRGWGEARRKHRGFRGPLEGSYRSCPQSMLRAECGLRGASQGVFGWCAFNVPSVHLTPQARLVSLELVCFQNSGRLPHEREAAA